VDLRNGLAPYDPNSKGLSGDYGVESIAENLPSGIHVEGYIYWQSKQLFFYEITGLQVRVNYTGIGGYDPTWLNYRGKTFAVRDKQITGELYITYSDQLHDALKTDREGFDQESKVYKELQAVVHKHLNKVLSTITKSSASRARTKKPAKKTTPKSTPPATTSTLPVTIPLPTPAATSNHDNDSSWTFEYPLSPDQDFEIQFEEICSVELLDDTVSVTIDPDHQLIASLPDTMKRPLAKMIGAMAAATATNPDIGPEGLVELSLAHLINNVRASE
jgi:hypothetical protein